MDLKTLCEEYQIPVKLVEAIIQVESRGNYSAIRFEPHYRYVWDVRKDKPFRRMSDAEVYSSTPPDDFKSLALSSNATEWIGQKMSWGAMQVMGAVAREYGFTGLFPDLCSDAGIVYGVKHLSKIRRRFFEKFGWNGVISAYNAGTPSQSNLSYVEKVRKEGFSG